jgi:hypothetical protein
MLLLTLCNNFDKYTSALTNVAIYNKLELL